MDREPSTVADALERAADLLEPQGAWGQHDYARARGGSSTDAMAADAECFCAMGAVYRSCETSSWTVAGSGGLVDDVRAFLADFMGQSFASWNDAPERTQAEVVAKLREAAALARTKGGAA